MPDRILAIQLAEVANMFTSKLPGSKPENTAVITHRPFLSYETTETDCSHSLEPHTMANVQCTILGEFVKFSREKQQCLMVVPLTQNIVILISYT